MGSPGLVKRAFSVLEIKSVDEELRVIEGVASTPATDRGQDILEPLGAVFSLPLPFMWQHGKDPFVGQTPVGHVTAATPTAKGIPVTIQMARSSEPGRLQEILDFAWQTVKKGLVRGLSIGFSPLEFEPIKGTYGLRFKRWDWLELSGVTIPMNAEANISTVKGLVHDLLGEPPASRSTAAIRGPVHLAGVSASSTTIKSMKPIAEQIRAFEATRQAKDARMTELMTKASDAGTTLDQTESEEYDGLESDVQEIDKHLTRLRSMETRNKAAAVPVHGTTVEEGTRSRGTSSVITVEERMEKGIGFARAVLCKVASFVDAQKGSFKSAVDFAKERYPDTLSIQRYLEKAAVPAGTTSDAVWAGPLVYATNLESEFMEFLRPMTIIGNPVLYDRLNRVPFNVRIIGQTGGGTGYWVGQGAPKPLTSFAFNATTLTWAKVAAIAVISEELARFSSPSAENLVRNALAAALIERIDLDLLDPTQAAVANVSPASLTHSLTPLTSSGTSADNVRTDLGKILKAYAEANMPLRSLVIVMPESLAIALSLMVNALGQPEFPNISMAGGSIQQIPVVTSQYVANSSGAGNMVVAIAAGEVFLSDDGGVTVDASRETALQMLDNPTNNSATATATQMVSMFQTNSIALRAERFINWAKRRADAVVYMDDVNWGSIGSPS